jgi:Dolichyl-phosphate-mannose-protein mannosyltransferase
VTSLLRRHALFASFLAGGALVRLVACLGYHPALWFSDAIRYASFGVYPYPDTLRSSGYPLLLLYPLRWTHSFMAVVITQHVLGLVAGAILYTVLLRRGLHRWAAALTAAPILLSAYQIQIEHFIMSDPLFIFLLVAALAALLWNETPGWIECAVAGLLLGTAAIVRSEGLPVIVAVALWLATRPGWRTSLVKALIACTVFMVPVAVYANWFHESYGHYNLTYSQGWFLASRVESFAHCAGDGIPRAEQWLCTTPGHQPNWYLDTKGQPLYIRGDSQATDKAGTSYAIHVIEAQPTGYATAIWRDVLENFTAGSTWHPFAFPSRGSGSFRRLAAIEAPGISVAAIERYDPHPSTRLSQPWASMMQAYQQVVVLPPVATAIIILSGLAGIALSRPRGGHGLLPWLMGVLLLVFPAATSGYGARYELAAIAPLCMAAALGLAEITGDVSLVSRPVEAT